MNWTDLVEKMGLPGVLLGVLIYGLWKSCGWIAQNILVPLTNRHMFFLEKLERNFDQIDSAISKIADAQHKMSTKIVCLNKEPMHHD